MAAGSVSVARLRDMLKYDPNTGLVVWILPQSNRVRPGEQAGGITRLGYLRVGISGRDYMVHRVAWALHYGGWPAGVIDHMDGNKVNNRIANLRDVPASVNMQNRRSATGGSSSGLLGASWHAASGRWHARIKIGGRTTSLGYHATPEDAHAAYVQAKRRLHAGCTI
jgi:hypothetical protein